jgi:hypothetical protein
MKRKFQPLLVHNVFGHSPFKKTKAIDKNKCWLNPKSSLSDKYDKLAAMVCQY